MSDGSRDRRVEWRGAIAFVALTYALAWTPFLLLAPDDINRATVLILPLNFVPALAAVVVRGRLRTEGPLDSGLRPRLRAAWSTYAVAAVIVPALLAVTSVIAVLGRFGGLQPVTAPGVILPGGVQAGGAGGSLSLAWTIGAICVMSFVLSLVSFGEEFGWRGYLLPQLMPLGQNRAILVSGVIWAAWHLPLNLKYGANGGLVGFPWFVISITGFGAVLGWLRFRSQSVWPASLLHSHVDLLPLIPGLLLDRAADTFAFRGLQVGLVLVGIGFAARGGLARYWISDALRGLRRPPVQ